MIVRKTYEEKISSAFQMLPIVVLIGARQVGKTSIMQMYPKEEFASTLFLNGQDVEVAERFSRMSTIEQYLKIYMNDELDGLLLIDEFQFINGISTYWQPRHRSTVCFTRKNTIIPGSKRMKPGMKGGIIQTVRRLSPHIAPHLRMHYTTARWQ